MRLSEKIAKWIPAKFFTERYRSVEIILFLYSRYCCLQYEPFRRSSR